MASMQKRNFSAPDETRTFAHGRVDLLNFEHLTFRLATFEPGWKWSEAVKLVAKTDSC